MRKLLLAPLTIGAFALSSVAAFAHHPLGGETPTTFVHGLLSGIGHPIIGLDHLAFVIAVGVAAFMIGSRFLLPLVFILATIAGTGIHLMAVDLPMVEFVISLSVAIVGLMILSGKPISLAVFGAVFAVAGLFHGHAYGEAVFGAEATPIFAYLAGFGITQYLVALLAGFVITEMVGKGKDAFENASARIAGGMVAGAGALLVGEKTLAFVGLG